MYTFKKEERLCSKKLLDELFHNGSSFLLYPFRITWLVTGQLPGHIPVQVVISVSKRKFRRAVDRNLLKRRMREIYRLNKAEMIYSRVDKPLLIAISYIGRDIAEYPFMEKKLRLCLDKLTQQLEAQYADKVD